MSRTTQFQTLCCGLKLDLGVVVAGKRLILNALVILPLIMNNVIRKALLRLEVGVASNRRKTKTHICGLTSNQVGVPAELKHINKRR
ncbi:hypothetical protein, partial [Cronobacter dublinensis]|uniref:hypothetical protein n=1 Tax=Cronobacter dublinensis TaxID=413497 RepID=UPI001F341853